MGNKPETAEEVIKQLKDDFENPEPLDPELKRCIIKDGPIGAPMLKHPLIYSMVYTPQLNKMLNKSLKYKKEYIEQAEKDGEFRKVLCMYERPYRIEILFDHLHDRLDEVSLDEKVRKEFWDMLWFCWSDTENFWQYGRHMEILLNTLLGIGGIVHSWECQELDEGETQDDLLSKKVYDLLPEKIRVYRGHQGCNEQGYSWTLCPYRARWFSERFGAKDAQIAVGTLRKDRVLSVLTDRREWEIATMPDYVNFEGTLRTSWPFRLQQLVELAKKRARPNSVIGIHGEFHWYCVYRNAMALCDHYPDVNRHVCELFAIFHDCCRLNDDHDPEHGPRAAKFIEEIRDKLSVTDEEFKELQYAMQIHTKAKRTKKLIPSICLDADRLDLTRVGIMPDKEYFSTRVAEKIRWTI